jgi:hypothetical protein
MLRLGRAETRHVREVGAVPQTGRRLATRTPVYRGDPVAGRPVAVPTAHERLNHQCRMPRTIAPRLLSSPVLRQGHVAEKHQGIPSAPRLRSLAENEEWVEANRDKLISTERPADGRIGHALQKCCPNRAAPRLLIICLIRRPCPVPGAKDHPVPC